MLILFLLLTPDADRLGVYVKDAKSGEYIPLTGNMSGMLVQNTFFHRERRRDFFENGAFVKTIVSTSKLILSLRDITKNIEVLTGFKYIGEQIKFFEQNNTYEYEFGLKRVTLLGLELIPETRMPS